MDGGNAEKIFSQQLDFKLGEDMAMETRVLLTDDGFTRQESNPLVKMVSESLLEDLNHHIEDLKKYKKELQKEMKNLETPQTIKPVESQWFQKYQNILNPAQKELENLKFQKAAQTPVTFEIQEN
jgi:hypothetical protein